MEDLAKNLKKGKPCTICRDSRKCFARSGICCTILYQTYLEDGECPFCKTDWYAKSVKGRKEEHDERMGKT